MTTKYPLQKTCPVCKKSYLAAESEEFGDCRPFVDCKKCGHTLCVDCLKECYRKREEKCVACGEVLWTIPYINKPLVDLIKNSEISVRDVEMQTKPFAYGAFGQVYSAKWRQYDVVIKVITAPKLDFKAEANRVLRLNHPNVIDLFGIMRVKHNQLGIVMEKAEHGSLDTWIGKMDHAKLTNIALGIISGLQCVHSQNVVHRNIKPKNILMFGSVDDMIPKITDFGVSALTQVGVGGDLYVAPEVRLHFIYDFTAADVYSLAMMLFEMFNEQLITKASEEVKRFILGVHTGRVGQFPICCKVPVYLRSVIESGWESNPAKRPTLAVFESTLRG